jgi:hypothetical protein
VLAHCQVNMVLTDDGQTKPDYFNKKPHVPTNYFRVRMSRILDKKALCGVFLGAGRTLLATDDNGLIENKKNLRIKIGKWSNMWAKSNDNPLGHKEAVITYV